MMTTLVSTTDQRMDDHHHLSHSRPTEPPQEEEPEAQRSLIRQQEQQQQQQQQQPQRVAVFVTGDVESTCEALWSSQDADTALDCLRYLQSLLIRDDHDIHKYDPSEAFLAVQGSVLRFGKSQQPPQHQSLSGGDDEDNKGVQGNGSSDTRLEFQKLQSQFTFQYEALVAVATLVKVGVGPAWWYQIDQRRERRIRLQRGGGTPSSTTKTTTSTTATGATTALFHDDTNGRTNGSRQSDPRDRNHRRSWSLPPQRTTSSSTTATLYRDAPPSALPTMPAALWRLPPEEQRPKPQRVPHIPEVLPAAMLRFAASLGVSPAPPPAWHSLSEYSDTGAFDQQQQQQQLLLDFCLAQIDLVRALCVRPVDAHSSVSFNQTAHGEWLIPGVQSAIGTMLRLWLTTAGNIRATVEESATERSKTNGWSARLSLLRGCNDVCSKAGWCPPPPVLPEEAATPTQLTPELVQQFLEIAAEAVVTACFPNESSNDATAADAAVQDDDDDQTSAEILACSTGIEAISALTSFVLVHQSCKTRHFVLPVEFVPKAVHRFLALFVELEQSLSTKRSLTTSREASISSHQEALSSAIARLLWSLMASETTALATVDTLLDIFYQANLSSPQCTLTKHPPWDDALWGERESRVCNQAAAACTLMSSALWGNAAGTTSGGQHLRVFWHPVLKTLLECTLACRRAIISIQNHHDCWNFVTSMSSLAMAVLRSLSRAIDSQIRGGYGILNEVEWKLIIQNLDGGVLAWLQVEYNGIMTTHSSAAACALVGILSTFLEHCASSEYCPFVEYESQKLLYQSLLQSAVPLLEAEVARKLGLAVIRSWAKFGLFPFRLDGWSQTSAFLLREAFRVNDTTGHYIHHATVRLEALNILTAAHRDDKLLEGGTKAAYNLGPSLLFLTQHIREQHLNFIETSIIPIVKEVLWNPSSDIRDEAELPTNSDAFLACDNDKTLPKKVGKMLSHYVAVSNRELSSIHLALYAVRLTGRLFAGVSGDRQHRLLFVDMLRSVALNERSDGALNTPEQHLSHDISVRFAAVLELGRCLECAFVSLPHAHESVPQVIDALSSVFDQYTSNYESKLLSDHDFCSSTVLAMAAFDPLTRLRVTIDYHIAFKSYDTNVTKSDDLNVRAQELISNYCQSARDLLLSTEVEMYGAPLVKVRDENSLEDERLTSTSVSFDKIVSSVASYLQCSKNNSNSLPEALSFTSSCTRIHCFNTLRHLAFASVRLTIPEVAQKVFIGGTNMGSTSDCTEDLSRSLALAQCTASEIAFARCAKPMCGSRDDVQRILNLLPHVVELLHSSKESLRNIGCHAVSSILPSLLRLDGNSTLLRLLNANISKCLATASSDSAFTGEQVTLPCLVFDLLHVDPCFRFPPGIAVQSFHYFWQLASMNGWETKNYHIQLAFRCLPRLLASTCDADVMLTSPAHFKHGSDAGSVNDAIEQLINRLAVSSRNAQANSNEKRKIAPSLRKHELLATDADQIERFQCESTSSKHAHVWHLEDGSLLTCRIGARGSKYYGYLEVVHRSLSDRWRISIKVDDPTSLENPEPSSIWSLQDCKPEIEKPETNSTENVSNGHFSKVNFEKETDFTGDKDVDLISRSSSPPPSDVIKRAADALRRFEAVMQSIDDQRDEANYSSTDDASGTASNSGLDEWLEEVLGVDLTKLSFIRSRIHSFISACGSPLKSTTTRELTYSPKLARAISVLDRTPVMETHKIALLYDQSSVQDMECETKLLATTKAPPAFHRFASGLGRFVSTRTLKYFSGGLDTSEYQSDGQFALFWTDADTDRPTVATTAAIFHMVNMMPEESPENRMGRKRHIGNDYVIILFADRESDTVFSFDQKGFELIGGGFGFVLLFVTLAHPGICRVNVRLRNTGMTSDLQESLSEFVSDTLIAEADAPAFVRNLAIRANVACLAAVDAPDALPNFLLRYNIMRDMTRFAA